MSRRRTGCASKSWRTRTRPSRSVTSTSTSSCRQTEVPKIQAWYAKTFGAKASTTPTGAPVDDVPGAQLRFNKTDAAQAPTKGRVLDHIGFDVVDLQAFIKKLEADGIKLDRPYTKNPNGIALAFITDPWGTYIELNERPKPVYLP